MFVVRNFKNINWEHAEFDEGKSQFFPLFSYVSHLTFLTASPHD